ncbi:unnamed protein product [Linum trigynum]|uniref:Uncharacterized protein n=1 Tax=Linum trigynum TaxID=586398 RepID=A0AAV2ECR4_9ROSI
MSTTQVEASTSSAGARTTRSSRTLSISEELCDAGGQQHQSNAMNSGGVVLMKPGVERGKPQSKVGFLVSSTSREKKPPRTRDKRKEKATVTTSRSPTTHLVDFSASTKEEGSGVSLFSIGQAMTENERNKKMIDAEMEKGSTTSLLVSSMSRERSRRTEPEAQQHPRRRIVCTPPEKKAKGSPRKKELLGGGGFPSPATLGLATKQPEPVGRAVVWVGGLELAGLDQQGGPKETNRSGPDKT